MLVYNQADKKRIDKAVEKAKLLHPRVKTIGFGKFEVAGTKENYTVAFECKDGELHIECGCTANTNGQPCYHAASTAQIYKLQVRKRDEERKLTAAYLAETRQQCVQCKSYTTVNAEGYCDWCEDQWKRTANAIETEAQLDSVREMYSEADAARDRELIFG
jgi:hypothetical protein